MIDEIEAKHETLSAHSRGSDRYNKKERRHCFALVLGTEGRAGGAKDSGQWRRLAPAPSREHHIPSRQNLNITSLVRRKMDRIPKCMSIVHCPLSVAHCPLSV